MKRFKTFTIAFFAALLIAQTAWATQIQDIVRLKGSEKNKLIGMGLVVGLKGTGDGGKYLPAMRSLAAAMNTLLDENVIASELSNAKNVAVVSLSVTVPESGARDGDEFDVHVSSIGAAKSLEGGRLLMCEMTHIIRRDVVFAYAEGALSIQNEEVPTSGVIKAGAQMTQNVWAQYFDEHYRLTLVIDDEVASWPTAFAIARQINDELSPDPDSPDLARAIDQKNVVISVPVFEREKPATFINRILSSHIDPSMINTPARVVINERTGTVVITGDARVGPVTIMHEGLSITTITPARQPTAQAPEVQEQVFVQLGPHDQTDTELSDLLTALNRLQVSAKDRIAIIREIKKAGHLYAELKEE